MFNENRTYKSFTPFVFPSSPIAYRKAYRKAPITQQGPPSNEGMHSNSNSNSNSIDSVDTYDISDMPRTAAEAASFPKTRMLMHNLSML